MLRGRRSVWRALRRLRRAVPGAGSAGPPLELEPGVPGRGKGAAWLVLTVSCLITAWAWQLAESEVRRAAGASFGFRVSEIRWSILDRLLTYEQVLRGCIGLFSASRGVAREQWSTYVEHLEIEESYPGILGIGYAELIRPEELAGHMARIRAEGYPEYRVWPEGERAIYSAIVFLEPFDWRNRRAFGYDMMSEPTRRAAMELAWDTGRTAVSGKITLVQETETDVQHGFLMYLPVYEEGGRALGTAEERRAAVQGFVYGAFRMNDLMAQILGPATDVALEIYDGDEATPATLMYTSEPERTAAGTGDPGGYTHSARFSVLGHTWTLRFTALPPFYERIDSRYPMLILGGGSVISLLLFTIAWSLATTRARAVGLAERMVSAIRESETRLREITATLGEGVVVEDSAGYVTFVNPEAQRLLGWDERELLGKDGHRLLRHSHADGSPLPRDRCPILAAVKEGEPFRSDDETLWTKDGSALSVSVSAAPIVREGRPSGVVIAFHDISERKAAEAALRESQRFRSLFEYARDALLLIETDGRIVDVNRLACESLGRPPEELIGSYLFDFFQSRGRPMRPEMLSHLLEREIRTGSVTMEAEQIRPDGRRIPVEAVFSPIDVDGRQLILAAVRDVTERRQAEEQLKAALSELEQATAETERANQDLEAANEELQRLSQLDGLTGIANRRVFDAEFEREWQRAMRDGRPIALVLGDVDHFKAFNDHYGHQAGDECLVRVAAALSGVLRRPGDLVARYGGEEFVAVLPGTDEHGARFIAERMRRAVETLRIEHGYSPTAAHVTMSLGVASVQPAEGQRPAALLSVVDKALYAAKQAGRNGIGTPEGPWTP